MEVVQMEAVQKPVKLARAAMRHLLVAIEQNSRTRAVRSEAKDSTIESL